MRNTKQVTGRRKLRFETWDDLIRDVERVAAGNPRPLGNWTAAQVMQHLAQTMNAMLDRYDFGTVPWWGRLVGWAIKNRMLNGTLPAGYKLPDPVLEPAPEATLEQALADLKAAIARWRSSALPESHPFFGRMSPDDWTRFHLRHSELHLSFMALDAAV